MDVYVISYCNQFVSAAVSMAVAKLIAEVREGHPIDWDDLSDGCARADGYWIEPVKVCDNNGPDATPESGAEEA